VPRQNRVDPFGNLIADPARGTLFGNRGVLHADDGSIVRRHALRRWIHCRLEFKGRKRELLQPGRYTELFFLDEATALAAGHRPCAECQRERYLDFRGHWMAGPGRVGGALSVDELDAALHAERVDEGRGRRTYVEPWARLPDGVMVADSDDRAYLVHGGRLLAWTPGGYGAPRPGSPAAALRVLTPRSVVAAIRHGYPVQSHASAL
jgi:hypothetical protein